ncbi:NAD(P)/FAD-dependent oxidoreductase [Nitrospina watsonii]|uniref:NADH:ubiquinone reductase (non-electrogenic) n=1 Tax=Nitrospina watsonii TaxID=1323948 RepID=A0ABN8VZH5_9BACT|nr:NAD(P)/FAD-dependent oxidoreductase [Nitrospina watsonii]CAI2717598.1 NADH dehydrogenase [Nitrospina watsonii]
MDKNSRAGDERPKVVIIGAGFGGLNCARALAGHSVDVSLLDRRNYHVFTPLLYQVATSLLNPSDIAVPVRTLFRHSPNVMFYETEVTGIDFSAMRVHTVEDIDFEYDYLVIASGSTTHFYGNDPLAEQAYGLKDLTEALELRNHIIRCFDHASRLQEQGEKDIALWLTFVAVGGGPTGVEYAGALGELVRLVMVKDYPELPRDRIQIVLVEAGKQLLTGFSDDATDIARTTLNRYDIEVILNDPVKSYEHDTLSLASGKTLTTKTVIWAAGVKASPLAEKLEVEKTHPGRLVVDAFLRLQGQDRVFAIGDIASFTQDEQELPMLASPAIQQGRYVARSILRRVRWKKPKPFHYRDRGMMAVIGRNTGIARMGRFVVNGFVGWLLWLGVHIFFLIGFRNRLSVLLYWAWNYVFYDRPARIVIPRPQRKPRHRKNARRKRQ